ncbi:MAG: DUF4173 domain-containing protein [Coriobacteriaceae bacterium]|jgi:hypothetical protein|nr:DUF4173 domain-containing protein [Coriobacteriaceae bacterium]
MPGPALPYPNGSEYRPRLFSTDAMAQTIAFTAREWLAVLLALGLAVLWFCIFGFDVLFSNDYQETGRAVAPGLGVPVFVFSFFAALFVCLGKGARLSPTIVLVLVGTAALALTPALFSDTRLKVLNAPLVFGACQLSYFLVAGKAGRSWCSLAMMGKSLGFFFSSLFAHVLSPVRALSKRGRTGSHAIQGVLLGLLIVVPVLLVVLPLLASADVVFNGLFEGIASLVSTLSIYDVVWRPLRVLLVAPLLFSLLYAAFKPAEQGEPLDDGAIGQRLETSGHQLGEGGLDSPGHHTKTGGLETPGHHTTAGSLEKPKDQPRAGRRASMMVTALLVLDALYVVFVAVQFAFLFGGSEALQISGGYAAYARSGFFQLVLVATINLGVVMGTVRLAKGTLPLKGAIRVLALVLIACTLVILLSAAYRMGLYVGGFGLTLLRALTVLGMAFIAVCLAAAAVKVFQEGFSFFRVFFTAGFALWIAFNYLNIDALIAGYNVEGYLQGRIEQVDVAYLGSLSPDALPALERLAQAESPYAEEVKEWKGMWQDEALRISWSQWSYSYARLA